LNAVTDPANGVLAQAVIQHVGRLDLVEPSPGLRCSAAFNAAASVADASIVRDTIGSEA